MFAIFDWDGTLSDSTGKIVRCVQQAASHMGLPVLTAEQIKEIIGLSLTKAVAQPVFQLIILILSQKKSELKPNM